MLFDQSPFVQIDGLHAESPIDQTQGHLWTQGPDPSDVSDYTLEASGEFRDVSAGGVTLTVTHSFTFIGGTLGPNTMTVASGATFTVQGPDTKLLYGAVHNDGTVVWNGNVHVELSLRQPGQQRSRRLEGG